MLEAVIGEREAVEARIASLPGARALSRPSATTSARSILPNSTQHDGERGRDDAGRPIPIGGSYPRTHMALPLHAKSAVAHTRIYNSTRQRPLCGWGEIRTHGTLAGPAVFKTAALNHSATHPHTYAADDESLGVSAAVFSTTFTIVFVCDAFQGIIVSLSRFSRNQMRYTISRMPAVWTRRNTTNQIHWPFRAACQSARPFQKIYKNETSAKMRTPTERRVRRGLRP